MAHARASCWSVAIAGLGDGTVHLWDYRNVMGVSNPRSFHSGDLSELT
jgi:hypothetical protein